MREREQFIPDHAIDLFVWMRSRVHLALTHRKSVPRSKTAIDNARGFPLFGDHVGVSKNSCYYKDIPNMAIPPFK